MIIAFIPVRGGSKSIPLKNIKPFCGKPLVCWNIEALECCDDIDQIVIATDSHEIESTIVSRNYKKTKIFHRSEKNASDSASTENVMLEFIKSADLKDNTTFILVQATSPLTQSVNFEEALQLYNSGKYDSILTAVKSKRFYWNASGVPLNYDYNNRPRRQDFDGIFMENGAFYINSVGNILATSNRLSGKIGIYEMPEYTASEIDEPSDWAILENIMRNQILIKKEYDFSKIKLFLCDVDGTLTDGGMYYSENGDELKKFNTIDGLGFRLLHDAGIKIGLITSETTKIVEKRAQKLQIDYLYQGKINQSKLAIAQEICKKEKISLENVAYIGDDVNCIELLSAVGFAACPANANKKVKTILGIHLMKKNGGDGCVREMIDLILDFYNECF